MTSNLVHIMSPVLPWYKQRTKTGVVWIRGVRRNMWDSTSAAIEANKFKLGTQLAFGEKLIKQLGY